MRRVYGNCVYVLNVGVVPMGLLMLLANSMFGFFSWMAASIVALLSTVTALLLGLMVL